MQTIVSIKPLLAVLTSLTAAGLILMSGKNPNVREFWSVLAAFIKFSIVISMAPAILSGNTIEYTLVTFYQGIDIKFRVDPLGLVVSSFDTGAAGATTPTGITLGPGGTSLIARAGLR